MRKIFGLILTSGLLMTNVWADIDCPAELAHHIDMRTMLPDGTPNPTYGLEIATGICGCLGFVNGVQIDENTITFTVRMVDNEPIRGIELDVYHNAGDVLHYGPEAYEDANGNGNYDSGESFTDLDGDGEWSSSPFCSPCVNRGSKLLNVTNGTMTLTSNRLDGFVKVIAYSLNRVETEGNGEEGDLFFITYGLPQGAGVLPAEIAFHFGTTNLPGTSMDPNILNVVCGYPDEDNPMVINTSNVATDNGEIFPDAFALNQNYPNPFNPSTQISFDVPAGADHVMINVYNILGQNVNTLVNEVLSPGSYTVDWNATDFMGNAVASGIYFYELRGNSFTARKKMLLIR
ncbi:MAG: T9SS type A sorting domain-containing protein [Candidatus Marinimicrobia bacterium]|nr:T9SS type A sorting domain-containing protein [Candidatus Neomarinimicrobiota bacterium]MBT6517507.1 T9SS type A sorting domain-containing protein [Candidatus Neomarinimicrobiota bacterium]